MSKDRIPVWDLHQLQRMAEENPQQLVEQFEVIKQDCPDIPETVLSYLLARALSILEQFESSEALLVETLAKSRLVKDYPALARGNLLLAKCYYLSKQAHKVHPCLLVAEAHASDAQDAALLAEVCGEFGYYLYVMQSYKQSLDYFYKAGKLLTMVDKPEAKMKVWGETAKVHIKMQQYEKAANCLHQAMLISQKFPSRTPELTYINSLSTVNMHLRRFTQAEDLLQKGVTIAVQHQLLVPQQQMLFSMGVVAIKQMQWDKGIEMFAASADVAKQGNNETQPYLLDLYNNLAVCYGAKLQHETALIYLDKAYEISAQNNQADACLEISVNKAHVLTNLKRYSEALPLVNSAIKIFKTAKQNDNLISALDLLATIYRKEKHYPLCIDTLLSIQKLLENQLSSIMDERIGNNSPPLSLYTGEDRRKSPNFMDSSYSAAQSGNKFIGQSEAHRKALNSALLAAKHPNANVIIMGESGTGKEVIARIIHQNSTRNAQAFVPVNASAITGSLFENEFFGHTKGSYTGAIANTKGLFLQAHQGTLFLDEITEMPMEFQSKLLRALESKKVTPIGSTTEVQFDCRVISSTNRNIHQQIETNQFRLDLFHRINTIEIYIPPLRNRQEDIELLAHHFINQYALLTSCPLPAIERSFFQTLGEYPFPGNVRELKNIIERLYILSESRHWHAETLLECCNISAHPDMLTTQTEEQADYEMQQIIKALIKAKGKQTDAAKLLNMSDSTLTRRIVKYHLEDYTRKGS